MDVTRVPVEVPTQAPGGSTNAYVVGDAGALLVDPARRTASLDDVLRDHSVSNVALTHHHPDHCGALAEYATEFDLTVWARAGREPVFEGATGVVPDRTFSAGTTIPTGEADDATVEVLDAPGHAPEHVAFAPSGTEDVLVGDVAIAEGSVVVGAPEGDMRAYLTSLRRLHARDPVRLCPGHGPVVENPRAVCERLIRHRLERERRVLAAVDSGGQSVSAIVDRAYDKDLTGVRDLAIATVRAHLEKLAVEGRLQWDGEQARIL